MSKGPCDFCGATATPRWRTGDSWYPCLCNACGIRLRKRSRSHVSPPPPSRASEAPSITQAGRKRLGPCDYCHVDHSCLWRKGTLEYPVLCNACGVRLIYAQRKKVKPTDDTPTSPLSLKREAILNTHSAVCTTPEAPMKAAVALASLRRSENPVL